MSVIYQLLGRVLPTRGAPTDPRRIVLIRPCCIGDVVMATAALSALRVGYPRAHLTAAVGGWSRQVMVGHPDVDEVLDTGSGAHPVANLAGFRKFVRKLREGNFDLAVSLVRSPKMSAAVLAANIPYRVGIDSAGRGFGYNLRAALDPNVARHEVDVYLDALRPLGINVTGFVPNVWVSARVVDRMYQTLIQQNIDPHEQFLVVNPSGGKNPGAQMDAKRYPPLKLGALVARVCEAFDIAQVVIVAGPGDEELVAQLQTQIHQQWVAVFVGNLSFAEIGAAAQIAALYVGHDTGLTHYAAAVGARVAMILGPTDPGRYRAYSQRAIALWKPYTLPAGGFVAGAPPDWNWERDGISVEEAAAQTIAFMGDAG